MKVHLGSVTFVTLALAFAGCSSGSDGGGGGSGAGGSAGASTGGTATGGTGTGGTGIGGTGTGGTGIGGTGTGGTGTAGAGAGGMAGAAGADAGADASDAPAPCSADSDCQGNSGGPVCDLTTGDCVACTPSNDVCAAGTYCDSTNTCVAGCASNAGCAGNSNGNVCDTASHTCVGCLTSSDCAGNTNGDVVCDTSSQTCVGCLTNGDCAGNTSGNLVCDTSTSTCVTCVADDDCAAGSICSSNACVPGCTVTHACPSGSTCCNSACVDIQTDVANCGGCGSACAPVANATVSCQTGACQFTCNPSFADCDGSVSNGCEYVGTSCLCLPGAVQNCYDGPPATLGIGECKGGTQTCDSTGTAWGPCNGEVVPLPSEICNNGKDDDCDGTTDIAPDTDGDGWTACNGDCCETINCATNPAMVNPGALEVAGDSVDNDCDGVVDNPVTTVCSTGQKFTGVTALDVAHAMDICKTTTSNPPLPSKQWGLISATQLHADGSAVNTTEAQSKQTSVTNLFGSSITPKKNSTLAVISSGMARDANDPGWVLPISGTALTSSITFPGGPPLSTYLAQHGGNLLPGHCGATTCPVGTGAYDSIDIRLVVRVPTNALGFSYDFRFFSAEYQTYQCTTFNDYFLALLTSGAAGLPADHNISFDANNNPVSVNNGFFQDCGGNGKNCNTCPYGTSALVGTGFDQVNGGATEWLTTDAPVVPGETMTIHLMVFDVSDHIYDTLVLLDNFRWSITPVNVGTHT